MRKGTPPIVALERGLELLCNIVRDGSGTNVAAQAATLDIPIASAHRAVRSLARKGFLIEVARGCYAPGPALAGMAQRTTPDCILATIARPSLSALARRTGAVAHIGTLDNDMVTYLVKAGDTRLFTREGMQLEAYCSAVGKVLLAHLPAIERERYLAGGPFVALTDNTITDPVRLDSELDEVRRQGFAVDDREVAADLVCLAVPLTSSDGNVRAAISLSNVAPVVPARQRSRLLAELQRTAHIIAELSEKAHPDD